MAVHLAPKKIEGEAVTRYALLSATEGHRAVAVTTTTGVGDTYSVFILTAERADSPWLIQSVACGLSETGATWEFRSYEQRG